MGRIAIALSVALVVVIALAAVAAAVFAPHLTRIDVARAVPATLITLDTARIDSVQSTAVEFWDDRGFRIAVPAVEVSETRVRVAVPPYIDPSTGAFGSGPVHLRVQQQSRFGQTVTNPLDLTIDALPVVAAAPGAVTLDVLATLVALAPGVNFLLGEAEKAHPSWSTSASAASIAKVAVRMGELRGAVLAVATGRAAAADLGTYQGGAVALTAAQLPQLDRLMAAWLLAIGPHSPSPCAAKDQYIDRLLHEQEFGEASTKIGSDFAAGTLTCASTEVLEVAKRTAGWLGVLGVVAATGGIEVPIQALATMAYVPLAAATTTLIATAQSIALTGGVKQDADNALGAIDLFQSTIVDTVLSEPLKALSPSHGPLYDAYVSTRFLADEFSQLRALAQGKPAPPVVLTAAPFIPTAAPALPTAALFVPTAAPFVPTAAPFVPTAAPFVPTAPPPVLPILSVVRLAWGPCNTPAKGYLPGWINCSGTVTLQINRPVSSGFVIVSFDYPSDGSFFHGGMHVGSSTGTVTVPMMNTYISQCVTAYASTVVVRDGQTAGPVILSQEVALTTTCG